MNEEWWESPACWLCDYWWALLLALTLGLLAYFTRDFWLPLLGVESPVPTPPPTLVSQPAPTATRVSELGTGDVQVTLTWGSTDDLDLWIIDPSGVTIFYQNPSSPSGGQLDVDANADCRGQTTSPVENIYWPTGAAPRGEYSVEVQYYKRCETVAPVSYHVRLKVDGQVTEYDGVIQAQGDRNAVTTFGR